MNRREFGRTTVGAMGALALGRLGALTPGSALWGAAADVRDPSLRVNGARLNGWLAELAQFGKNPQGGVSRTAYSEADRQGRAYVRRLMQDAGLDVRLDAAGNILGRRGGRDASRPPLLFGSHID